MPQLLPDHPWQINYASDTGNPIADFYIPALQRSTRYDRKTGFFNSAILRQVAAGLGAFLENDGRMRLIMSCQLDPADLQAIQRGYDLRETVNARLIANLEPPQNFAQLKRLEILSWLIQADRLDIRIGIPVQPNGHPIDPNDLRQSNYLYHEKVCLFTDADGNQIATTGSNNESGGGWQNNVESFQVFSSWEGDRELMRVQTEAQRFEQHWHNDLPTVRVFEVPEAVRRELIRYAPARRPTWNPADEFNARPLKPDEQSAEQPAETQPPEPEVEPAIDLETIAAERAAFAAIANIHDHPGCLQACLDSIPIKPWPHQIKILKRVAAEFPRSFLIADEVGLGKTIETGLILRYLLMSRKIRRVLILAPASVQPQWHGELREKFNLHFWSYTQGQFQDPYGNITTARANPWDTCDRILASSHLVRRQDRSDELLAAEPWDLVVVDEAHHARRKSPQQRKDTPNRLLELLRQLRDRTKAMVLLSATPMQIDPIEMFDLLDVLGLSGHWAYGDNFCDYFASLSEKPNEQTLNFWKTLSNDYFQRGNTPCPRLQASLKQRDRMLASRITNTWQKTYPIVSVHKLLADRDFIETSRQFLSTNTPLKDMMFRHTRDTLREYYQRGLLERDVPRREVYDDAVTLEPTREAELYREVGKYVRHFYRLAQKEKRKALGFLMTLYRKRLTSSFYAIQQSLQRRLTALLDQQGSGLVEDDLIELEDADDAIITGLEDFIEPVDPREIDYLESLLQQFENTGEDTKLAYFIGILRQELATHDSAIAFTQYTDTMDFLREELRELYGDRVACYSGRGGESWHDGHWRTLPKEAIAQQFREGRIKLLLCTESASEGLNLQTCGVLINYDLPWNPMRVEQRIGRIDRIGQRYPTVTIHNFYYDGTVEAKVYLRLRERIGAFTNVVGNLQPILAQAPTFLERAAMSVDELEENVVLSEFDRALETPPLRPAVDDMVKRDVEADLEEIRRALPPSPVSWQQIEATLTRSPLLQDKGYRFIAIGPHIWQVLDERHIYKVTFDPITFSTQSSLQLMTWGDPLFEELIITASKLC